jgi:hypothetical protein
VTGRADRDRLRELAGVAQGTRMADPGFRTDGREPLIAVLTAHLTGPLGDLRAGQALQRTLLTATAGGLAASFLSRIVEVPTTREALRRLVRANRTPQAVLRIGRGRPIRATPSRQVVGLLDPRLMPRLQTARP